MRIGTAIRARVLGSIDQLLSEGQRELADELAARVAGRPLSFGPVIAAVEGLVA